MTDGFPKSFVINFLSQSEVLYRRAIAKSRMGKKLTIRRRAYDSGGNLLPGCLALHKKSGTKLDRFWKEYKKEYNKLYEVK